MIIMIYHYAGYEDWAQVDGENTAPEIAYLLKWRAIKEGAKREILQDKDGDCQEYIYK